MKNDAVVPTLGSVKPQRVRAALLDLLDALEAKVREKGSFRQKSAMLPFVPVIRLYIADLEDSDCAQLQALARIFVERVAE